MYILLCGSTKCQAVVLAFLRTLRPSDEREQLATRLMEETRTGESGLAGLREATQLRWLEIQWEAWPAIL